MATTLLGFPYSVRSPPPDPPDSLRRALERNLEWVKDHIPALSGSAVGSPKVQAYIDWIFDRLKDRVPPDADPEELDRLVRAEVRKAFLGRRSRQPPIVHSVEELGDIEDQSARDFERALETADEVRECLACLTEQDRELVMEAYTLTEDDLATAGLRERMAKRLGITRDALDQRISRARRRIRERRQNRPGSKIP